MTLKNVSETPGPVKRLSSLKSGIAPGQVQAGVTAMQADSGTHGPGARVGSAVPREHPTSVALPRPCRRAEPWTAGGGLPPRNWPRSPAAAREAETGGRRRSESPGQPWWREGLSRAEKSAAASASHLRPATSGRKPPRPSPPIAVRGRCAWQGLVRS